MPGWGSMLTKAGAYVGSAAGYARAGTTRGFNYGSSYLGVGGMAAATGATGGALYGATLGRDPGQSRLGGAMSGALGGAALGLGARYGYAAQQSGAFRTARSGMAWATGYGRSRNMNMAGLRARQSMESAWSGIKSAGQRDFAALSSLAGGSNGLIGSTLTKGYRKIKGLFDR